MPLTILDTTEDRDFREGETIYDVDGNAFTVRGDHAEMNVNEMIRYDLSERDMRDCFSRANPPLREIRGLIKRLRDLGCAVVVFTPEELGERDGSQLEDVLVERGNNFLAE